MRSKNLIKVCLAALFAFVTAPQAVAERIKDMAQIQGVRTNQLVGYGLVVGLDSTGDQTSQAPFTVQSLNNMLAQLGITVPANVTPQLKTGRRSRSTRYCRSSPGQTIDITVNSIANAKSLRGGSARDALHGLDGRICAIAQGNHRLRLWRRGAPAEAHRQCPGSGRIPNGATVERAVPSQIALGDSVTLNLNDPDFTTATRLVASVNKGVGDGVASIMDGGSIKVRAPIDSHSAWRFCRWSRILKWSPAPRPPSDHQFAHRRRHQQPCRDARRRIAWFLVGDYQRRADRHPAQSVRAGQPWCSTPDHQIGSGLEPHVPVQARHGTRSNRARWRCRRRARDLVAILEAWEAGALRPSWWSFK